MCTLTPNLKIIIRKIENQQVISAIHLDWIVSPHPSPDTHSQEPNLPSWDLKQTALPLWGSVFPSVKWGGLFLTCLPWILGGAESRIQGVTETVGGDSIAGERSLYWLSSRA